MEETGLEIEDVCFLTSTNTIGMWSPQASETKHYVTIFMVGRVKEGEPKVN
jgi:hypothetical protein